MDASAVVSRLSFDKKKSPPDAPRTGKEKKTPPSGERMSLEMFAEEERARNPEMDSDDLDDDEIRERYKYAYGKYPEEYDDEDGDEDGDGEGDGDGGVIDVTGEDDAVDTNVDPQNVVKIPVRLTTEQMDEGGYKLLSDKKDADGKWHYLKLSASSASTTASPSKAKPGSAGPSKAAASKLVKKIEPAPAAKAKAVDKKKPGASVGTSPRDTPSKVPVKKAATGAGKAAVAKTDDAASRKKESLLGKRPTATRPTDEDAGKKSGKKPSPNIKFEVLAQNLAHNYSKAEIIANLERFGHPTSDKKKTTEALAEDLAAAMGLIVED